jgi:hypothetical protein
VVVLIIIVGGGAFYGGMSYAGSQAPAAGTRGQFAAGGAGFAGRTGGTRTGAGFTAGQIVSAGNGSISIQQQNGSSTEIVLLSPTTQILKSTAGTASDLTQGESVTVTGTSNSDGSLTATAIQIRPAGMGAGRTAPTTPAPTTGQ